MISVKKYSWLENQMTTLTWDGHTLITLIFCFSFSCILSGVDGASLIPHLCVRISNSGLIWKYMSSSLCTLLKKCTHLVVQLDSMDLKDWLSFPLYSGIPIWKAVHPSFMYTALSWLIILGDIRKLLKEEVMEGRDMSSLNFKEKLHNHIAHFLMRLGR